MIGMQAYEHDAADIMGERSESLQPMKVIWTAHFVLFAKCIARRQCSACVSMATSHDVLRVRVKQMGSEAYAR